MKKILAVFSLGLMAGSLFATNLIQNGSFELDSSAWFSQTNSGGNYVQDVRLSWDPKTYFQSAPDKNAPDGRNTGVYTGRKNTINRLFTRPYFLNSGKYQLSGNYRSTTELQLFCNSLKTSLKASPEWKSFSLPLEISGKKGKCLNLNFISRGEGEFRIDNIRLEKLGDTQADYPVETASKILSEDRIFQLSESRKADLLAYATKSVEGVYHYEIKDINGKILFSRDFKLKLAAGESWKKEISLNVKQNGSFHLMTEFLVNGKACSMLGESLFAVIPDRKLPTSPEDGYKSRFGCNMGGTREQAEIARKIGVRWVMCAPPIFTKWMCTQPRPEEWIFYDEIVNTYSGLGLNLAGNLADPPYWATNPGDKGYGGPWPNNKKPTDMKQWDEYVQRTVKHYYPRIKDWVVSNEPDHVAFYGFDPATTWCERFADLQKRTYKVVKSVNQNIRVIAAGTTHSGSLRQLLEETDAIEGTDIGAFHFAAWTPLYYTNLTPEERGEIAMNVRKMNKIMKEKGKKILLWDTEAHLTQADFEREYFTQPTPFEYSEGKPILKIYTRMDAVNSVARMYLSEWAIGIDKTFFWLLAPVNPNVLRRADVTILEWDSAPTAVVPAYAAMTHFLEGAELISQDVKSHKELSGSPKSWTYNLTKGKEKIRVLYTDKDRKTPISIQSAKNAVVYDVFGNPMTDVSRNKDGNIVLQLDRTPVYIVE